MVILPSILGLIPPLIWLAFFLREDASRPEPKRMIVYVFIGGALAAALAAIPEYFLQQEFPPPADKPPYASPLLLPFAFIEEVVKFLIVYLLIKRSRYFDERVDAMIYMITAGLGFAALENIFNLVNNDNLVQVFTLRAIGATLLHALASGTLGFHWVRSHLTAGIIAATVLHFAFNYFVLLFQNLEIYTTGLLLLAAIFLFHDFEILKARDRLMSRFIKPNT